MSRYPWLKNAAAGWALGLVALLSACSSSPSKPQPAALPAVSEGLTVSKAWSMRLGEITTPLQASVQGTRVVLASSQGMLLELDAQNGQELSRLQLKESITAGVGSDGKRHAVVTSGNELVVVQDGREIWRQKLNAQTFTAPLVAGERVFVQSDFANQDSDSLASAMILESRPATKNSASHADTHNTWNASEQAGQAWRRLWNPTGT